MRLTTLCYLEQDGKYLMLHRIVKKNDVNKDKVAEIFDKVKADGRDTLLGSEAYAVAKEYGIEAAPIILSTSPEEAADFAEEMGFPVVLKIASDKILHIPVKDINNFRMYLVSTGILLAIASSYLLLGNFVLPMIVAGTITYSTYILASMGLAALWLLIGKLTSKYIRQYLLIKHNGV